MQQKYVELISQEYKKSEKAVVQQATEIQKGKGKKKTEGISKDLTFCPGDTVSVSLIIKEGEKERIQQFKGIVLQRRNSGVNENFTIRKISHGIGVEKIIPIACLSVQKIEVLRRGKVRRARLFYLRERKGKAYKTKNKIVSVKQKAESAPQPEGEK